ncbi:flagellar basal-body MS-ring/collar protein FliF [Thalassomonas sp. RHCl1]|uniref:flagellar basal-body MS-ring/collar protein FliF n=1 Tax=Thalassomonas sp. RHCl1 TaxID=2995320 RepID=UPI00248BCBAE|nr:flagellar basal-body MS-ring/collar protein FliF [Thalassomonas sp. RHCl1]
MELVSQQVAPGQEPQKNQALDKAKSFFSHWRTLSGDNRAVLQIALLAGVIAATIVIILWTANENYVPLYGKQELYDQASILELLEQEETLYRLDQNSGQILVPEQHLAQIRMSLAARGVKMNLPSGMDGLDGKTGLGISQFMESMRYRHALEGELARSIITMDAIRSARVHLALPKRTLFIGRNEEKPTASVMLDLQAGRHLEQGQVEAIVNLVANSLPGMKPEGVSVVDQSGRLLSLGLGDAQSSGRVAMQQVDYKQSLEARIQQRASDIIYPLVGADNFRIQVTADLDFSEIEETVETVSPDTVVSKENIREQTTKDVLAFGVPGSLTNQPPIKPDADSETAETSESKQDSNSISQRNESSKEYQVGRSVVHKKHQQGRIEQLSVSVILNNKVASGENGWTDAELAQIANSVEKAIGINKQRGDQFTISGFNFVVEPQVVTAPEVQWWQQSVWQEYLRYLVGAILGLALIFMGVRPLVRHLIQLQSTPAERDGDVFEQRKASQQDPQHYQEHSDEQPEDSSVALMDDTNMDGTSEAKPQVKVPELPAPGSEFSVQLAHLQLLADKETVRVAEVLKNWVNTGDRGLHE